MKLVSIVTALSLVPLAAAQAPDASASRTPLHPNYAPPALREQAPRPMRPMIGIQIVPVDDAVAAQLPEHIRPALILTGVFPNSAADKAGLQLHDVLSAVDGDANVTLERLKEIMSLKQSGDSVTLEVYRRGIQRTISVVVTDFVAPRHHNIELDHSAGHVPDMEYWENFKGQHPWPRFGMTPDGKLQVQKEEGGFWEATDTSVDMHNALKLWNRRGNDVLDLNIPHVDPDGTLRNTLKELNSRYRNNARAEFHVNSEPLQERIAELEQKLDNMEKMILELLQRTKR